MGGRWEREKLGAGGGSAVAIFNGRGLACLWAKRHRCLGWPGGAERCL